MSNLNPLEFYLCPQPEETVFTGVVSSAPSDPYVTIAYNTGVTGSFGAPLAGQTVEIVGRGKRRLKTYSGGASGTLGIDESDDVGPIIQAGDTIKIYNQFRLWPRFPRFVQSGQNVTIFADYDIAYTNQTNQWRPTANAGPVGVGFIEGATASVSFVGDRSQAHAAGATLTNYLWTARGSVEGTSTSQGTEASPVVFTWSSPGWYLISLRVTDSNGNTHTNYTYVVIIDPASPTDSAFVDFDVFSDSFDFEQGGGTAGFTVRGDASTTNFPEEGLIVHACRGTQTTTTGSWPFRENTLFAGWIMHDTVRQNPDTGEVSFRAATIDSVMKNLSMFPASLTDKTTPVDWTQGKQLTVDRLTSFLAKHWSTLDLMTPIVFSGDTRLIRRQDFGPGNLYGNLQNNLVGSILGKVASSQQGALYLEIDYNVQNTSERAGISTNKTLHKGVWANDFFIEERADYEWPANQVKMSGIYYNGSPIEDICPLFSEAPGDAMKAYGRENNFDRLILAGQTDLNTRSGHMLEKLNQRYMQYRGTFFNDAAFTIVPQALFPVVIESGDNDRALTVSKNLIPRKINRTYNHENGYYQVDVEFEPETSGQPGVTVDIPCGPPEQKLPGTTPPPTPSAIPGTLGLMAGTTGTSWYFARGIEQTWERRVQGLSDPAQLPFLDSIADPWTAFKQGYSVESIIIWGCGYGFLVRSANSGKNWGDRTSYLPDPAWSGETGSVSTTSLIKVEADLFAEDRTFVLGTWQDGSNYRGAVALAEDGFAFNWYNITGSAQVRPLGMSLDKGNGATLYITTWESEPTGTIYLRAYNVPAMTLAGRYDLGVATAAEIDAYDYYATPFNRRGGIGEVFAYGRLNNPQGFGSGTVHIFRNTNYGATGSWSIIENTWGTDLCTSFGADVDNYYYAVRGYVTQAGTSELCASDYNEAFASDLGAYNTTQNAAWNGAVGNTAAGCADITVKDTTGAVGITSFIKYNGVDYNSIAIAPGDKIKYAYRILGGDTHSDANTLFRAEIDTDGGNDDLQLLTWADVASADTGWLTNEVDLTPYAGETLQFINFYGAGLALQPGDADVGTIYIDDIQICDVVS